MSGKIYLLRHARIEAPAGVMVGSADYPLSEAGRRQALFRHEELKRLKFDRAFSSPLMRARQTSTLILNGRADDETRVEIIPAFREISLGRWEGLSRESIIAKYPLWWERRGNDFLNIPPPGGESFVRLEARVRPAWDEMLSLAASGLALLVVAHQAVIRVIISRTIGHWPIIRFNWPWPCAVLIRLSVENKSKIRVEEIMFPPF